jgi:capsular exopolysaccharide synthesis family protein
MKIMPRRKNRNSHEINVLNLINDTTSFQIVEAYKNLRANLLFALSTSDSHAVAITSSEPSAGKSYTCANLAITMAQTGNHVLIVDADMRKPVTHKLFQVPNQQGLSTLLSGSTAGVDDVLHKDIAPNVDLITSGPIPPNPSELLGHKRMENLLDTIAKTYDYIFIDTPPINVVSDAMMLTDKTAGVLMVARQRQSTIDEVHRAVDKYRTLEAPILGIVLTDVGSGGRGYAYGRYSYYSYNYYQYEYK